MNVLVTGGAGFLGSYVAEALLRQGNNVAVLDNFDDFYSQAWKRRNLKEVALSGNVPIFGDSSAGRDYTYVDDIVAGV